MKPRLQEKYENEIQSSLAGSLGRKNILSLPRLQKIVVNMGVGDAARDSKIIEGAIADLSAITGQRPRVTRAKNSIAQFKLREGQPIGGGVNHGKERDEGNVSCT